MEQKSTKSLNVTQDYYNESKSISAIEIKEFSIIYLIINNLKFFIDNINLIKNIKLFNLDNSIIFKKIISGIEDKSLRDFKDLNIEEQVLKRITKFASIKYILDKSDVNDEKIMYLLDEIKRDLKNLELEMRIQELESKFSEDFNENTFNELKELKKLQKIN